MINTVWGSRARVVAFCWASFISPAERQEVDILLVEALCSLLTHQMGFGKTALIIALIALTSRHRSPKASAMARTLKVEGQIEAPR